MVIMSLNLFAFSLLSVFAVSQGFVIKDDEVANITTATEIFYEVCSKNPDKCFYKTEGCQMTQNCSTAVAFEEQENNTYTFYAISIPKINDTLHSYVAFGFAEEKAGMGPGSVVQCVAENGIVNLYLGYNEARTDVRYDFVAGKLDLLESHFSESLIFCKFTIEPGTVFGPRSLFSQREESYYIIGAAGLADEASIFSHHEQTCASKDRFTFKRSVYPGVTSLYSLCSKTPENCVAMQDNCIANQNCSTIVGYESDGKNYTFYAATTKINASGSYVALGFADQQGMGPGSVVQCVNAGDGSVNIYNANLTEDNSMRDEKVNGLTLLESSFSDDVLFCKFTIAQRSSFGGRMLFSKQEEEYYLLAAAGQADDKSVHFHHGEAFPSQDKISFKIDLGKSSSSQIQPILVLFFIMQLLVNKFM